MGGGGNLSNSMCLPCIGLIGVCSFGCGTGLAWPAFFLEIMRKIIKMIMCSSCLYSKLVNIEDGIVMVVT